MRTSKLVDEIIKADANYFAGEDFITYEAYRRIRYWLNSGGDNEAQLKAASWLRSDAEYFKELAKALCRHHWYIYPLMALMMWIVPRRLRKYANELESKVESYTTTV